MVSHAGAILTLIMSPAAILLVVFAFFQKVADGQRVRLRAYVLQSPKELKEKLWKRLEASAHIEKATALVTCTICLEDILPGQPVRRLRCGHLNLGCEVYSFDSVCCGRHTLLQRQAFGTYGPW